MLTMSVFSNWPRKNIGMFVYVQGWLWISMIPALLWSSPHPTCVPHHASFLQEMSDLKKYNPPPGSSDLYLAASKHFQQAKLILENVATPDPEVRKYTGMEPPVLARSLVTQSRITKHQIKVNKLPFTKPQAPEVWRTSLGERVHTTQNGHRLAVIPATH